ncbi:hypothetical protein STFE110948_04275 [Streptobacillus felis]|uniref:Lipoprotein n=1 Tax=Streptobacillus felis TaxID=1384509 RepID=A0A7Z0PEY6_9FUSO|nr:hypothetical protein [Streptobacillus felis]NYV27498.1 hypothetical protein [Streptobacillus felis]
MKKLFLGALVAIALTSCSTVVNGKGQNYKIKSNNNIQVVNKYGKVIKEGKGELDVYLEKGDGFFSGASYTVRSGKKEYQIQPKVNVGAFVVGNFFVPGLWGWIVDGATGAMYDLYVDGEYKEVIEF